MAVSLPCLLICSRLGLPWLPASYSFAVLSISRSLLDFTRPPARSPLVSLASSLVAAWPWLLGGPCSASMAVASQLSDSRGYDLHKGKAIFRSSTQRYFSIFTDHV
ncbi:uncharacterized protein LOC131153075 isoform X2 [Malania oleifera]|uniref:uncharacterized protein LOC131153075 isoform X2 n=1 Tax=Malania oleifera TaxID=397392 RepID=UPI0025AEAB7A|nr:uncharacterized protein LOC131153075 isoform X2 [Malania oleifera]